MNNREGKIASETGAISIKGFGAHPLLSGVSGALEDSRMSEEEKARYLNRLSVCPVNFSKGSLRYLCFIDFSLYFLIGRLT